MTIILCISITARFGGSNMISLHYFTYIFHPWNSYYIIYSGMCLPLGGNTIVKYRHLNRYICIYMILIHNAQICIPILHAFDYKYGENSWTSNAKRFNNPQHYSSSNFKLQSNIYSYTNLLPYILFQQYHTL